MKSPPCNFVSCLLEVEIYFFYGSSHRWSCYAFCLPTVTSELPRKVTFNISQDTEHIIVAASGVLPSHIAVPQHQLSIQKVHSHGSKSIPFGAKCHLISV